MSRILYLAELYKRSTWEAIFSTPADDYSRVNNIYYFDKEQDETSYWVTEWGGSFDNPTEDFLQILFNDYLTEVFSSASLLLTENTFYQIGSRVYINIPLAPWMYFTQKTEILENTEDLSFSSGIGDVSTPTDWTFGNPVEDIPPNNIDYANGTDGNLNNPVDAPAGFEYTDSFNILFGGLFTGDTSVAIYFGNYEWSQSGALLDTSTKLFGLASGTAYGKLYLTPFDTRTWESFSDNDGPFTITFTAGGGTFTTPYIKSAYVNALNGTTERLYIAVNGSSYLGDNVGNDNFLIVRYDGEIGRAGTGKAPKKYKPYLKVPSVISKLSDPVSGISLNQKFNFTISNEDGILDDLEENNFFNTRFALKKTTVENPSYSDFNIIRAGLIEYITQDFKNTTFEVADFERFFDVSIHRKFTISEFPDLPDGLVNTSIPKGYNNPTVPLIKVHDSLFHYVAIDPQMITDVSSVRDSDGVNVSFTLVDGVIIAVSEAEYAVVEGPDFPIAIGEIITSLVEEYTYLSYVPENWDQTEVNYFNAFSSAAQNFYFADDSLKVAINKILKSVNGFLITKNDGRLTLRYWGGEYETHQFDSWKILNADKLKKNYKDATKYYNSTVEILYQHDFNTDEYGLAYVDDSREKDIFEKYRKSKKVTYKTDIIEFDTPTLEKLATSLLDRYGEITPLIKVDISDDTTDINILDKVFIEIVINGRDFLQTSDFVVREIDPGQDTMILESIGETGIEGAILDNYELAILDNNDNAIMGVS